jgi:uncharacterized protein YlxW (UPF0749 family)
MRLLTLLIDLETHPMSRGTVFVRWLIRLTLSALAVAALRRGERLGREEAARFAEEEAREAARRAQEITEFIAQSNKETEEYLEKLAEQDTQFYRNLNSIRAHLGLEPVGEKLES